MQSKLHKTHLQCLLLLDELTSGNIPGFSGGLTGEMGMRKDQDGVQQMLAPVSGMGLVRKAT